MSKVVDSLEPKAIVGSRAVYLNDKQVSIVKSTARAFGGAQYRHIKHDIPHHLQLRLRDTVKRLQLLNNRRSHEQRLWEFKCIFGIENIQCFMRDLLVDPKQCRIQRSVPSKLCSIGFGGD